MGRARPRQSRRTADAGSREPDVPSLGLPSHPSVEVRPGEGRDPPGRAISGSSGGRAGGQAQRASSASDEPSTGGRSCGRPESCVYGGGRPGRTVLSGQASCADAPRSSPEDRRHRRTWRSLQGPPYGPADDEGDVGPRKEERPPRGRRSADVHGQPNRPTTRLAEAAAGILRQHESQPILRPISSTVSPCSPR